MTLFVIYHEVHMNYEYHEEIVGKFDTYAAAVDYMLTVLNGTPATVQRSMNGEDISVSYYVNRGAAGYENFKIYSREFSNIEAEAFREKNNKMWERESKYESVEVCSVW